MSEDKIELLKKYTTRLGQLLDDPHPGLATWNLAVVENLKKMSSQLEPKKINWDLLKCEEASIFSRTTKIDCGKPAEFIIWHNGDRRAWAMCLGCGDHNVRNRGGIELARKEE